MHIQIFTFGPFLENTYVIHDDKKQCWIIDPGMSNAYEEKEITDYITANGLIPQSIINTHAHIDHILGVDYFVDKYNIAFYLHEQEQPILANAGNTARMFGFNYEGVKAPVTWIKADQKTISLDNQVIYIRFVPGHSPGSIALYNSAEQWVISGDALFERSIGRTDLLMGDHATLINSIKTALLTLPDNTIVYAGHGSTTTIGAEKTENPFLS